VTRRPRPGPWANVLLGGLLALRAQAASAAGLTKAECITANEAGQTLRLSGQLSSARDQLRQCVAASCPSLVRKDCAERLAELERVQPTLLFEVRDGAGTPLGPVSVKMDGELLAERPDGEGFSVDPGMHAFTVEVFGVPPVSRQLAVREGEVGRRVTVIVDPASGRPSDAAPAPGHSQRLLAAISGGVGLAGIVVGTAFGLKAASSWSTARGDCTPTGCPDATYAQATSARSDAATSATASTVAFVGGGALLATGVLLWLTAPRSVEASAALRVTPVLGPAGAGVGVGGRF
jgi:hypothetical protein